MTKTNTTFYINGGAGRVITSIPALEKYARLNPNDNFKVLVNTWDILFWSHPLLQDKTYNSNMKGAFDLYVKDNILKVPEPYHSHNFYNQKITLAEAFDEIINETNDHTDLNSPNLYLSDLEIGLSAELVNKYKKQTGKDRLVVYQPYGSGTRFLNGIPFDQSNRSLTAENYYSFGKKLSENFTVMYASKPEFRKKDDIFTHTFDDAQPYLRVLMGLIYHCDYFIGCDSVGQHIAKAFNKKGLIFIGGTNEYQFSYPEHFSIIKKDNNTSKYIPWRVSECDSEFADRSNNGLMNFNSEETEEILKILGKL